MKSRNKGFVSCRTQGLRVTVGVGADGHGYLMYVTLSSVEKTRPICIVWPFKMAVFLLLVHPLLNQLLFPLHLLTRLCVREWMLSNCSAGEDSGESLGLQGDQASQP